jgi:hypothetical protein
MHLSRLCAVLIDCRTADLDEAARFWGGALGRSVDPNHPSSRGNYLMLERLDIETMLNNSNQPSAMNQQAREDYAGRIRAALVTYRGLTERDHLTSSDAGFGFFFLPLPQSFGYVKSAIRPCQSGRRLANSGLML